MDHLIIRDGKKEDMQQVFELIKELAVYEKALHEVENTIEKLQEDGFGSNPLFGCIVAELEGKIVGITVYYFRYSTWKGKRLFLEDIIVTESLRGRSIGKLLFEATIRKSYDTKCNGMLWQVLDWNQPAINFYKKYKATFDHTWVNTGLSGQQVQAIIAEQGM